MGAEGSLRVRATGRGSGLRVNFGFSRNSGFSKNKRVSRNLWAAASIGAITAALPGGLGVYGGRASAQALPAGCVSNGGVIGEAEAGETVTCLAPPTPIGEISTNVDDITIIVGDAMTPTTIEGVFASGDSGITIDTSEGTVLGDGGIRVLSPTAFTSNTISITTGAVTGTLGTSISASNSNIGDIMVTSSGAVSGGVDGVSLTMFGGGDIIVDAQDVTGTAGDGIEAAIASSGGGGISITAAGDVSGGINGVNLRSFGQGDISVNLLGSVTGGTDGITVDNDANGPAAGLGSLIINVADVTGTTGAGIRAFNDEDARDLSITATGTVSGGSVGIDADNIGAGSLSIDVADVAGNSVGISAVTDVDARDMSITSSGLITGATAVSAIHRGTGDLTINVHSVTGRNYGIVASNEANGTDLTITAAGTVSGDFTAINASNTGSGALTINAMDVSSRFTSAIYASNTSDAALSVTAAGNVTSSGSAGIAARQSGAGDVVINANEVSGNVGVLSTATTGATTINLASTALVTSAFSAGIDARSTGGAITLQGASGDVVGATDGLAIASMGGAIEINDIDSITGNAGDGIDAASGGGAIAITSVGAILGTGGNGVLAVSDGGDVSIQGSGLVGGIEGTGGDGVNVVSGVGEINIGGVAALGDVAGSVNGITAMNASGGGSIIIDTSAGAVSGGTDGIYAANAGAGDLSVTVADVTGATGAGINAFNSNYGGELSINASATVTGYGAGIAATNDGSGSLTITVDSATGTASYGDAIEATNFNGGDLTVTATGALNGGDEGVSASNYGDGALSITVADVTGEGGAAVGAIGYGTDFSIVSTGTITAAGDGVNGAQQGSGATSISVSSVTAGGDGLDISSSSNAADLSIVASGAILADNEGIIANHDGAGALTITAATVSGASGRGVFADNSSNGTDLSITTTGAVTGGQSGIAAYNYGSGATTIEISGAVAGMTEEGVLAVTSNGASITVNDGGSITGATAALRTTGAAGAADPVGDTLTLNAGGSIMGDAFLLAGDDTFNAAGGTFASVFGGDGTDTANFSGAGLTVTGADGAENSVREFEVFNFNAGGFDLAGAHVGLDAVNFLAGANTLSGSLASAATTIAAGASLDAADGASVIGGLTNAGTLSVNGPGIGTLAIDGDFTQTETGVLNFDINGADADLITVTGDVTLAGGIGFISAANVGDGPVTQVIIDGDGALTGAFDPALSFNSGLLLVQEISLDVANADVLVTSAVNLASTIPGLNLNQSNVGDNLISQIGDADAGSPLANLITAVGGIETEEELAAVLNELHPESLDVGLNFLNVAQRNFLELLTHHAQTGDASDPVRTVSLSAAPVSVSGSGRVNVWGAVQGFGVGQGSTAENIGFDGEAFAFAAGISGIQSGPVTLGFAGGYSNFDGDSDGDLGDAAETELFHVGASLHAKLNEGGQGVNSQIDVGVAYAGGDNNITQNLINPATDAAVQQTGRADVSSVDGRVQWTVKGSNGQPWLVQPLVRAGFSLFDQEATAVGAAEATALNINDLNNTRGHVGVGASLSHQLADRFAVNARATAVQYFGDTQNVFSSSFAAAPAGGASFQTFGQEVEQQVELSADLSYGHKSGFTFNAGLFGEVGDLNVYGARASISKRF